MSYLNELRTKLERRKGKREQLEKSLQDASYRLRTYSKEQRQLEKAREVIKLVARITQEELSMNIAEISTMAMETVFDNPYTVELEFVERRNRMECDIWFSREGVRIDPYSAGGGAADVVAFALRVASWQMMFPRPRAVLVLDEPFKHLKGAGANERVLEMVREVSHKLGLQVIMVSDERVPREVTMEYADALFEVRLEKGKSIVEHK